MNREEIIKTIDTFRWQGSKLEVWGYKDLRTDANEPHPWMAALADLLTEPQVSEGECYNCTNGLIDLGNGNVFDCPTCEGSGKLQSQPISKNETFNMNDWPEGLRKRFEAEKSDRNASIRNEGYREGFEAGKQSHHPKPISEERIYEVFANHSDFTPYLNFDSFRASLKELGLRYCKYIKREGESCTLNDNCKYPNCPT
jgi:flagellar biosynthesis/type III secretory pathway protein FliH